jgi:hypothetical protein
MPTNTHYIDGDNYQLRQIIFANTPKAIEQCKSIAQKFRGETELQTCENIFNFLKTQIRYEADGSHQKIKLPSALLREKVGDCKSYSLFTGAILSNLGIPWKYVLVSYRPDPTPTHIYVVTDSGIIIDAVWGIFNSEKKATHKYYHKPIDMRISTISGIGKTKPLTTKGITPSDVRLAGTGLSGPRAFIWFRDMKKREVTNGEAVEWRTKNALLSLPRAFVLAILENNGGGISSMLNNLVFKTTPTHYNIPQKGKDGIAKEIEAKRIALGVPKLTDTQKNSIFNTSVTLSSGSSTSTSWGLPTDTVVSVGDFAKQQAEGVKKRYEAIFGAGSYQKYLDWKAFESKKETELKNQYTVYPSEKARKQYGEFENAWFWKGGDPWDVLEAIKKGATKSPKGKDFNYIIRIGTSRGLKTKDLGLLIRAITSTAFGSTFSLDSPDSFVMGKGKGIGVVDWVALASSIEAIASILGLLFGLFKMFFPSGEEEVTEEQTGPTELEQNLANGWMTKADADLLKAPQPYLETKTVDGVEIVLVDENWRKKTLGGEGMNLAGFGNIALPLLIGGAVIMALNTSKKLK